MLDKSQTTQRDLLDGNASAEEIARFDAMASEWWDPNGKYKTALAFNRARLVFFHHHIQQHFERKSDQSAPLSGLRVLDIGCGGGLISESLAKAGARVTGIDASGMSIAVARRHAAQQDLQIDYRHCTAEDLPDSTAPFDLVINAEVVEHVPDQVAHITTCCQHVAPGGLLILATLNRTWLSYLVAIVGAEYVLGLLPKGTHSWQKFVRPSELLAWCNGNSDSPAMDHIASTGLSLNPLTGNWFHTNSLKVNYAMCLAKAAS